jgi:ribose-phosphate pyrophosphokinase
MLLFSGSSNRPLTEKIADELKIAIANSETIRFADGEVRVRIMEEINDQHVAIVQSFSYHPDSNIMELCEFAEVCRRGKAKKITAVVPYLAYSRQHRAHRAGETISVKLVADFMKASGVSDCIVVDLHEEEVVNFFKIPVQNLSATPVFAEYIDKNREDFGNDNLVIISPDKGRILEANNLAQTLEVEVAYLDKNRPLDDLDVISSHTLKSEIKNKDAIIYDDMISTGSTAASAAKTCIDSGAFRVNLIATHALFSRFDAIFWQKAPIDRIVVSDSIAVPQEKIFPKLEIVSLAAMIAKNLANFV